MKGEQSYLQCCNCGRIHHTTIKYNIDDLYIEAECPKCGHQKHLLCGEKIEDIYLYYDNVMDPRFYEYENKTK